MKKILAILVGFLVLAAPVMAAIETVETLPIEEPGITPDSPLYTVDKTMEKIQLRLTTNEAKRAELRFKFAEERLAEAEEMNKKEKPEFVEELMEEYDNELQETNNEMEKAIARGKDVNELTERVAERTARHLEVLQGVYEKVPEEAKEAILHAIEMSSKHTMEIVSRSENGETHRERIKAEVTKTKADIERFDEEVEIEEVEAEEIEVEEVEAEEIEIESENGNQISGKIVVEINDETNIDVPVYIDTIAK